MNRKGFTLPLALVVLLAVSMMVATSIQLSLSDYQANRGGRLASLALYAAEAGSQRTLARWSTGPFGALAPGDSASTGWTSLPDGASYRSSVLRVDDGTGNAPLFRVLTEGRPSRASAARRQVVTMVTGGGGRPPCCDAALSVVGRLRVDAEGDMAAGEDGEDEDDDDKDKGKGKGKYQGNGRTNVDGRDHVPFSWAGFCPAPGSAVAALEVPTERDLDLGRDAAVIGTPVFVYDAGMGQGVVTSIGSTTYDALAARADIVYTSRNERLDDIAPRARRGVCDTADDENWGAPENPGSVCWDYLPIIHARGNLRLEDEGHGQGILLVDGDLDVRDEFRFYGLVVVRGTVNLRDEVTITGGLLAGNRGQSGPRSRIRDEAVVEYSSCAVARATGGLGGTGTAQPLPGRHWFEP